jgi:putative transposase
VIDQITAAAEKANNEVLPTVGRMCELLGVSRSGWYAHRAHLPGKRTARRVDLAVKIKVAHDASDGVNGAPRILADLRDGGEVVSRKTVARIMREKGSIRGISPRPWRPVTTIPDTATHHLPDLVERRFDQGHVNLVWTSDI